MNWLLRRVLALGVQFRVRPENAAALLQGCSHPVCYVLERRSVTDLAVLQEACLALKLPRPGRRLGGALKDLRSFFYLTQPRRLWERPSRPAHPPTQLVQMIRVLRADPAADFDLVPVAVYWGRAPQKEARGCACCWLRTGRSPAAAAEVPAGARSTAATRWWSWMSRSRCAALLGADLQVAQRGRRVARALRALYARQRAARIGPDLSHRRTIVTRGAAHARGARGRGAGDAREEDSRAARPCCARRRYAQEIAANYSHAFVRFMERALTRLWNRLYDGVELGHVDDARAGRRGQRDHLRALPPQPHGLPAAVVRDLPCRATRCRTSPPASTSTCRSSGASCARAAAFFIRRSFRGSALYTVVFMKYLAAIMARGHPIEYFIEGGRSRTGRLLQPKTGMLAMTVRSFLRDPRAPVVFVPVYFGYERVVEGRHLHRRAVRQAQGEGERARPAGTSWRVLRERFGKVHVNIGEPIALARLLDRHEPRVARATRRDGRWARPPGSTPRWTSSPRRSCATSMPPRR